MEAGTMMRKEYPNEINPPASTPRRPRRRHHAAVALAVAMLVLGAGSLVVMNAGAQPGSGQCNAPGKNVECSEFGEIWMDSRADIKGERVTLKAEIMVYTLFEEQSTRWFLFSVRNNTGDSPEPVDIKLKGFSTEHGDIITTREEQKANEVNLWVDVLDLPTHTPITMTFTVGATERGAFVLEALVMAFDRGYAPVQMTGGDDAVLFAFTLLGVSQETGSGGLAARLGSIPAPGAIAALSVLALAAVVASRRRGE